MEVKFVLLCEGTSDSPLVDVLRSLLIQAGASSASGEPIPITGTVESKVRNLLASEPEVDLVFVHRDADSRDPEPRYQEIHSGAVDGGWTRDLVCVVPVQMTEAWLLTSESEIREVADKRNGKASLNLPSHSEIERISDAKGRLHEAYMNASESTGRRRKAVAKSFGSRRAALLQRLDINGDVCKLDSFARLRADVIAVVSEMAGRSAERPADESALP